MREVAIAVGVFISIVGIGRIVLAPSVNHLLASRPTVAGPLDIAPYVHGNVVVDGTVTADKCATNH